MILWTAVAAATTWSETLDPEEPVENPPVVLGMLIGFQGVGRLPFNPALGIGGEALFRLQYKATLLAGVRIEHFLRAGNGPLEVATADRYSGWAVLLRVGLMSKTAPFSGGVMVDVGPMFGQLSPSGPPARHPLPTAGVGFRGQFAIRPVFVALEAGPVLAPFIDGDFVNFAPHVSASIKAGFYL